MVVPPLIVEPAAIVTSWPLDPGRGSGTARFVRSLLHAWERIGANPVLLNPTSDIEDYVAFTLRRVADNLDLASHPVLREANAVVALDYDGFAYVPAPAQRFVVTTRAVFADLIETEPEPYRSMLRLQAMLEERNVARADCVVTPSAYARGRVIELYGIPPERVRVIHNGIDLAEWDALGASLGGGLGDAHGDALEDALGDPPGKGPSDTAGNAHRHDHGRAHGDAQRGDREPGDRRGESQAPTVLAVSKLYPRKMIETLVRATPLLRRRLPEVQVRIVGAGFQWDELRALARQIGAEDGIAWLGDVTERAAIVREYRRCHVFTHPSIQDAFANVCLEAMASARPLVVSDAGSMPELVRASGAGVIVPPREPEALAEALLALLVNDARREQLGQAGRRFAETMTWERTAAGFLEALGCGSNRVARPT